MERKLDEAITEQIQKSGTQEGKWQGRSWMARLGPDSGRAVSALLGDGNVLLQTVWGHEMFSTFVERHIQETATFS